MKPIIKPPSSSSRSNKRREIGRQNLDAHAVPRESRRAGEGYALLVVMAAAVLLLISLSAVLPSVFQEARREKEEELVFRGIQYARAIALFHRQFQRFPITTKELLQTNNMRFLRKEFKDPMDKNGKWRFIHANSAGVMLDSKLQGPGNRQGGPGGPPGTSQSQTGSDNSQSNPDSNSPSSSQSSSSSSSSTSFGSQSSSSSFGFSGQQSSSGMGFGSQPPSSGFSSSGSQSQSAFGGAASGNQIMGAFIVGVAATSHKESIRKWNNRTHYDEWEFLGVDLNMLGLGAGLPGQGGMAGQPQGSGPFGNRPQSGFGNQPSSGFGPQPTNPGGSMFPSSPPSGTTPPPQ